MSAIPTLDKRVITRGDIYYVSYSSSVVGSEQEGGRPAIIISSQAGCDTSSLVTVIFLTTEPKNNQGTHVEINSIKKQSTALCEQINTISKTRLGDYYGSITSEELELIDQTMCFSLGIKPGEMITLFNATENSIFDECNKHIQQVIHIGEQYKQLCDLTKKQTINVSIGEAQLDTTNFLPQDILLEIQKIASASLQQRKEEYKVELKRLVSENTQSQTASTEDKTKPTKGKANKSYTTVVDLVRDMISNGKTIAEVKTFMGYKTNTSVRSFLEKNNIKVN